MTYIQKLFGHTKTVLKHKYWVFRFACKLHIPVRGFFHDFSKFNPIEFFESVKYYTGKKSPILSCKADKGYSRAWQHHKGHNPHHYEYWVDNLNKGGTPILIPFKYCLEMVCDYLAAGKTYQGKKFSYADEYNWWMKEAKSITVMHPAIMEFLRMTFLMAKETNGQTLTKKTLRIYYNNALRND